MTGELLNQAAIKGARLGNTATIGEMCHDCAFRLGSDANNDEAAVNAAADCLAFGATFNCHIDVKDQKGNIIDRIDRQKICAGFAYAKQYVARFEDDESE